jgi:ATP-binding cassette subfamily B protein
LRRPGASPLPDSAGEAVSRFKTDVDQIPLFVILVNDIMVGLAIIAVSIVLMTRINPSVTIMALIPLVIVGIIANIATSRIQHYRRASRQAAGKVTGFIGEFFGAVQAVKVASAEKNVIGHFHKINDERRVLTVREKLFDEVLGSLYRNTSTLGTGVILVLVGQSMRTGDFTLGDFSLFVYCEPSTHHTDFRDNA